MRAYLPAYRMLTPRSLAEAVALLSREPGAWQPFAGGTDLMVLLEAGKLAHRQFLNLWPLQELRAIEETPEWISLGALTTYTQVRGHAVLQSEFPMVCRAAAETGGIAIQNRGTVAGNIANASPAADTPPALIAYDAEIELVSADGARRVPYYEFHTGYKKTVMQPNELIRRVWLPRLRPGAHFYRKVGTRRAQAISKVCFAGRAWMEAGVVTDIRLALGSVAPTVLRCTHAEAALKGRAPDAAAMEAACAELEREISPIDDFRSTAAYRRRVAANLLEQFLLSL